MRQKTRYAQSVAAVAAMTYTHATYPKQWRNDMILALDTGTKTGWAISDCGQITHSGTLNCAPRPATKKRTKEPSHIRYLKLWEFLEDCVKGWDIHAVVVEESGYYKTMATTRVCNRFIGIVELFAIRNGLEIWLVNPMELKEYATGKGSSNKDEMMQAARARGWQGTKHDEADAYLLASWGCDHILEASENGE